MAPATVDLLRAHPLVEEIWTAIGEHAAGDERGFQPHSARGGTHDRQRVEGWRIRCRTMVRVKKIPTSIDYATLCGT